MVNTGALFLGKSQLHKAQAKLLLTRISGIEMGHKSRSYPIDQPKMSKLLAIFQISITWFKKK
jgi:hypothetical protein